MQTYQWQGYQENGRLQKGVIEASNKATVRQLLQTRGIVVRSITQKRGFKSIRPKRVTHFLHQLYTLLQMNMPLDRALDLCQTPYLPMQQVIAQIKQCIENGDSLANALRTHPKLFHSFCCDLIEIGEHAGTLCVMLKKIVHHQEKSLRFKRNIIKICLYPTVIFLTSIAVVIGLLLVVIPQFESIFAQFGATLPFYTRLLIRASHLCRIHGVWLFILVCMIVSCIQLGRKRVKRFSYFIEQQVLQFPLLGRIRQKVIITRFAHTLSITHEAGLSILTSLDAASKTCGSVVYHEAASIIKEQVSQGIALHAAMQHSQLFPEVFMQLIRMGEESATLADMLHKIANEYEADMSHLLETFSGLLEPIIMALLGLLIGSVVIALYLPIMNLSGIL